MKNTPRFSLRAATAAFVIVVALIFIYLFFSSEKAPEYKTSQVKRGDIAVKISSTGTLEPEEVVDVGAQVAGLISELGTDSSGKLLDYGSQVKAGMLLAKIDESLYRSDVEQAQAQKKRAEAALLQMQAKLFQAERDWKRAQKIGPSTSLSQSAYDAYEAGFKTAQANVSDAEAQIAQAVANLSRAERNLGYCTIASPVDGVIIDRRVSIGQTVVASLNAPSLFLIAKDLRQMEVWVSVNEADIGSIHPGQRVHFTVDAFPGEDFSGQVTKVRLNATMTQNVVTYVVEVSADNSSGRLLPYLTANVQFEVISKSGVLLVPNAALRWRPKVEESRVETPESGKPKVWVHDGADIRSVEVTTGISDGAFTEVSSNELSESSQVVVGSADTDKTAPSTKGTTNPFAPNMSRGSRRN